tara:strand:- start:5504 stop:5659 length:156 start_codon:yes stop_codon:yes gene_type:complete
VYNFINHIIFSTITIPKYYEEYYNNGQLKVRDKYNSGNYKSSKFFDENGKK